ncbi:MAG TPA: response regulator [Moraxellaceae bacterium]|nr:response regulator [Moraxellaceae bacterium]
MSDSPTVLIVDDHPLMRRGLRQLLELHGELVVAAEAGSGEEALDLAQRLAPALVLLDVHMPQLDGVETLACLRHRGFAGKVVMISVSDAEADVRAAFRHGADGYLLKDAEPEELPERLRHVLAGGTVLSPGLPEEWSRGE